MSWIKKKVCPLDKKDIEAIVVIGRNGGLSVVCESAGKLFKCPKDGGKVCMFSFSPTILTSRSRIKNEF